MRKALCSNQKKSTTLLRWMGLIALVVDVAAGQCCVGPLRVAAQGGVECMSGEVVLVN